MGFSKARFWLCYSFFISYLPIDLLSRYIQNKVQTPYSVMTICLLTHSCSLFQSSLEIQVQFSHIRLAALPPHGRLWDAVVLFHLLPQITLFTSATQQYLSIFQDHAQECLSLWNHSWSLSHLPTIYTLQIFIILTCSHVCFSLLAGKFLEVKACVLWTLKSPKPDITLDILRSITQMMFLVKGPSFLLTHKITMYCIFLILHYILLWSKKCLL